MRIKRSETKNVYIITLYAPDRVTKKGTSVIFKLIVIFVN